MSFVIEDDDDGQEPAEALFEGGQEADDADVSAESAFWEQFYASAAEEARK